MESGDVVQCRWLLSVKRGVIWAVARASRSLQQPLISRAGRWASGAWSILTCVPSWPHLPYGVARRGTPTLVGWNESVEINTNIILIKDNILASTLTNESLQALQLSEVQHSDHGTPPWGRLQVFEMHTRNKDCKPWFCFCCSMQKYWRAPWQWPALHHIPSSL